MSRSIPHSLVTGKIKLCRLLDKTSSRQAPPKGPPGFSHTYLSFGNATIPTAEPAFPHPSRSSMSTAFELLQGCDDLAYTCKLVMPHARVHTHKSHTARLAEVEYLGNLIINVNRVNHEILLDLRPSVVHVNTQPQPFLCCRCNNKHQAGDTPTTPPSTMPPQRHRTASTRAIVDKAPKSRCHRNSNHIATAATSGVTSPTTARGTAARL